jgi:hypothetical protein
MTLALLISTFFWAQQVLDSRRWELKSRLDKYENVVKAVEARKIAQPGPDELKEIALLDESLRLAPKGSYQDERNRHATLTKRMDNSRFLRARFSGRMPGGVELTAAECLRSKEQLQLAANAQDPQWTLDGTDGLLFLDPLRLTMKPYGTGTVYCYVHVTTTDGFTFQVRERDDVRHLTTWGITQGKVILATREDEKATEILHSVVLPPNRPAYDISIFIELSPTGIRSWWPFTDSIKEFSFPDKQGLRANAPATIEMVLPKDSKLRTIEIWPERAPFDSVKSDAQSWTSLLSHLRRRPRLYSTGYGISFEPLAAG